MVFIFHPAQNRIYKFTTSGFTCADCGIKLTPNFPYYTNRHKKRIYFIGKDGKRVYGNTTPSGRSKHERDFYCVECHDKKFI